MPSGFLLFRLAAVLVLAGCAAAPVPPAAPRPAASRPAPPAPARAAVPPVQRGPVEITSDCGITRFRETILKEVNAARAVARSCGSREVKAAPPLAWNAALAEAAERHSVDMALRKYFDHASPEGARVGQRVTAQRYNWRTVGENLAGGDTTVGGVIRGWLGSPEHCQNMMSPAYLEIGASCVRQPGSRWGNYWTMVLATRR